MDMKQVIEFYGNPLRVAAELGVSHQTITNWGKEGKKIPRIAQLALEKLSKGKLKADSIPEFKRVNVDLKG